VSVLQEIYQWAKELRPWQSDALSRLLTRSVLTGEDYEDLYALLKADQGIPDPKSRKPRELIADSVPAPIKSTDHVQLLGIKNLARVNAIAENHRLPVGSTGLTVIYGDNGSGKSGYTRVLKRACRARDQSDTIHPNLRKQVSGAPATATFEIEINQIPKELHWTDGKTAPPELSSVAIFDSRCARLYLDEEDDFSYVPYGLDVFQSLSNTYTRLKKMLEEEHGQATPDLAAFTHLRGATEVGKLITALSAKTTTAQIDVLAILKPEEGAQYEEIGRSLKENNAKEKAAALRTKANRVTALANNCQAKGTLVSPTAYTSLRTLAESYLAAKAAAVLAAAKFTEGENLLPGTGAEPWRELFDAARRFAAVSHPNHTFPDLGPESPCPLCQEPLEKGAARLKRFETFITHDAETTSQKRRMALLAEYNKLKNETFSINFDDFTYGEIEAVDKTLAEDTRTFERTLQTRKQEMMSAVTSQTWQEVPPELNNTAERLRKLAERISQEAETLERAADEKARAVLQSQFNELEARVKLSEVRTAIITAAQNLALQSKLNACQPALRTTAISNKAAQVAEKVISRDLEVALNNEFNNLGVIDLQVALHRRAGKGKTVYKLALKLAQNRTPRDILSEGEQRAIAIGSFLAEVNVIGAKGAVVFDDPVSSLDHSRREYVANGLVSEGTKRQVIIFTHDIYFLCLLIEAAEKQVVPILLQSLSRTPDGFGVADPEVPFEGRDTTKRIDELRKQCQSIRKLYETGDIKGHKQRTREAYVELRMSWERALEEVLFGKVVIRFRKSIMTDRLKNVLVDESDYPEVEAGMTKCSNYAHDKAMEGGSAMPHPDELLADINALDKWRVKVVSRSRALVEGRKALSPAAK
jgi:ABC-type dipeptide/oligopeptide/nickel transport system ATPase subunit